MKYRATELALPAVPLGSHLEPASSGTGYQESAAKTVIGGRTAMSRRPPAGPSVSGGEHPASTMPCVKSAVVEPAARQGETHGRVVGL